MRDSGNHRLHRTGYSKRRVELSCDGGIARGGGVGPAEGCHSPSTIPRFARTLVASAKLRGVTFIICFAGESTSSASGAFDVVTVQSVLRYFRTAEALISVRYA